MDETRQTAERYCERRLRKVLYNYWTEVWVVVVLLVQTVCLMSTRKFHCRHWCFTLFVRHTHTESILCLRAMVCLCSASFCLFSITDYCTAMYGSKKLWTVDSTSYYGRLFYCHFPYFLVIVLFEGGSLLLLWSSTENCTNSTVQVHSLSDQCCRCPFFHSYVFSLPLSHCLCLLFVSVVVCLSASLSPSSVIIKWMICCNSCTTTTTSSTPFRWCLSTRLHTVHYFFQSATHVTCCLWGFLCRRQHNYKLSIDQ